MFFSKKRKEEPEKEEEENEVAEEAPAEEAPEKESDDASLGQMKADVDKLKAQFTTFYELQKANTEHFSRINESVGELRTMIIDRDKESKLLEAKATQAIDIVKTVQPDKMMIELRKLDGKIEALRANLEGNESIMNNVVNELKETRQKMATFKGMEQVVKLSEDVKKELMDIRRVDSMVSRHAGKVETIFSEMQKRFSDFDKFSSVLNELDKAFKQVSSDFDSIKIKIATFASKKEVENLINKFENFEKHTSNIITLVNQRFEKLKKEFDQDFFEKFDRADKLLMGFEMLARKTPDLDKYFNLLEEEAKKAPEKEAEVEKIKEPGEEAKEEEPEEKEGVIEKIKDKISKKEEGKEEKK